MSTLTFCLSRCFSGKLLLFLSMLWSLPVLWMTFFPPVSLQITLIFEPRIVLRTKTQSYLVNKEFTFFRDFTYQCLNPMCSHTACVYIQFSWPSALNVVDLSAKRAINTPYQARLDGLLVLESRPSERLCYLVIIS